MHYLAIATPTLQRSLTVLAGICLTVFLIQLADRIQTRSYAFRWQNISSRIQLRVVWLSLGAIIVITILPKPFFLLFFLTPIGPRKFR